MYQLGRIRGRLGLLLKLIRIRVYDVGVVFVILVAHLSASKREMVSGLFSQLRVLYLLLGFWF
jgi:hypothetical protein